MPTQNNEYDAVPPTSPTPQETSFQEGDRPADDNAVHTITPIDAMRQASRTDEGARGAVTQLRLPDPVGVIRALVTGLAPSDFVGAPRIPGAGPSAGSTLMGAPGETLPAPPDGAGWKAVSIALPLTDNAGEPFPLTLLRTVVGNVAAAHGGATLRPAFGLCLNNGAVEIDALMDVEVWTTRPEQITSRVGEWRRVLRQREIVVRVADLPALVSFAGPVDGGGN
jgi:hypothetical protein